MGFKPEYRQQPSLHITPPLTNGILLDAHWLENNTAEWPPWAESILRILISSHGLSAIQPDPSENKKMEAAGKEFCKYIDHRGWEQRHNTLFYQRLKHKILQIRKSLRNKGRGEEGRGNQWPGFTEQNPTPQSADPTTKIWPTTFQSQPCDELETQVSSIPNKDTDQALEFWNLLDANTQRTMFRAQLQSAKNPKTLIQEMANFCVEKYSKNSCEPFNSLPRNPLTPKPTPISQTNEFTEVAPIRKISVDENDFSCLKDMHRKLDALPASFTTTPRMLPTADISIKTQTSAALKSQSPSSSSMSISPTHPPITNEIPRVRAPPPVLVDLIVNKSRAAEVVLRPEKMRSSVEISSSQVEETSEEKVVDGEVSLIVKRKDLKTMVAERIREMELKKKEKRRREYEGQEEVVGGKRVKDFPPD
ncbi:hypothetical protein G7Y89_g12771 [Cudoniella acicularis]|uniref:Uncharacterized protein n=1 Tax=Cudoniella acicularis TaxID=354080 RepID=A0A8H4R8K2_9HELO|nr:hypothetical protein G7Y89_g12771 [Cudoniella acicularis]